MVLLQDDQFRQALINHRKEITELKKKIKELSEQEKTTETIKKPIVKTVDSSQNDRISFLENELKTMNERYVNLLEKLLELIGNRKSEIPKPISDSNTQTESDKETTFGLDSYQMLFLLNKSKATSEEFAASANQLKEAYNLNKTERTLRTKLSNLVEEGYARAVGKKPIRFFLTDAGMHLISKEQTKLI